MKCVLQIQTNNFFIFIKWKKKFTNETDVCMFIFAHELSVNKIDNFTFIMSMNFTVWFFFFFLFFHCSDKTNGKFRINIFYPYGCLQHKGGILCEAHKFVALVHINSSWDNIYVLGSHHMWIEYIKNTYYHLRFNSLLRFLFIYFLKIKFILFYKIISFTF